MMFTRIARDVHVNFILKENRKLIIMEPAKCQLQYSIFIIFFAEDAVHIKFCQH